MVSLSYRKLGRIARSKAVRAKLDEVADGIADRARAVAAAEGLDPEIVQTEGTRPKGRPYARVGIPVDQEFGTAEVPRRRILGRAVRQR